LFWINGIKEADGFLNSLTQCSNPAFRLLSGLICHGQNDRVAIRSSPKTIFDPASICRQVGLGCGRSGWATA